MFARWHLLCLIGICTGTVSLAQGQTGRLLLTVVDPAGHPVAVAAQLQSASADLSLRFETDSLGHADLRRLPFSTYTLTVDSAPWSGLSEFIPIVSSVPAERTLRLHLVTQTESVHVSAEPALLSPDQATSPIRLGSDTVDEHIQGVPGRSLIDLINTLPGWLYEGNAVLHPRGSEYQTQYVLDGVPIQDNRSPGFGPTFDADELQAVTVYTAGFPAEFGGSLGGVIALDTIRNSLPGWRGSLTTTAGGLQTTGAAAVTTFAWGHNSVQVSGSGNRTNHYLNPVTPENDHNSGTTASSAVHFEGRPTLRDDVSLAAFWSAAHYGIPNELIQQNGAYLPDSSNTTGCPSDSTAPPQPDCVYIPGGQRQRASNQEPIVRALYQHTLAPNAMLSVIGMVRRNSNDFLSNPESWPVLVTQHNHFIQGYGKAALSLDSRGHALRFGVEGDRQLLSENFHYMIPDCADPDGSTCPFQLGIIDIAAPSFTFEQTHPSTNLAAYVQDTFARRNWSFDLGVRWDHHQLLTRNTALSPRISFARTFPAASLKLHFSWDHVFEPPSPENILLSSSPLAQALDLTVPVVQLPVEPSSGNYYEFGATRAWGNHVRLDANLYRRQLSNYADDSQIFSTGISFPIAFSRAIVYGTEARLDVPAWGRWSGFASWSWMVGNVWNPVTGGLFLGGDASSAVTSLTGHFPDSQDQRNSARTRLRYQLTPRMWLAAGADFNSGLPFEANQTRQQSIALYGQAVVDHLNFDRGRILPSATANASFSAELYHHEQNTVRFQLDTTNLGNHLQVIDFGGLFSGNAIGPGRLILARIVTSF